MGTEGKRAKKGKKESVGARITGRLKEFAEALETSDTIPKQFTRRTVKLDLEPIHYSPDRIKDARKSLNASQAIFAQFLGVSVGAVRDWEQGAKTPRGAVCRVIDEILRDPKYWRARLETLAVPVGGDSEA